MTKTFACAVKHTFVLFRKLLTGTSTNLRRILCPSLGAWSKRKKEPESGGAEVFMKRPEEIPRIKDKNRDFYFIKGIRIRGTKESEVRFDDLCIFHDLDCSESKLECCHLDF